MSGSDHSLSRDRDKLRDSGENHQGRGPAAGGDFAASVYREHDKRQQAALQRQESDHESTGDTHSAYYSHSQAPSEAKSAGPRQVLDQSIRTWASRVSPERPIGSPSSAATQITDKSLKKRGIIETDNPSRKRRITSDESDKRINESAKDMKQCWDDFQKTQSTHEKKQAIINYEKFLSTWKRDAKSRIEYNNTHILQKQSELEAHNRLQDVRNERNALTMHEIEMQGLDNRGELDEADKKITNAEADLPRNQNGEIISREEINEHMINLRASSSKLEAQGLNFYRAYKQLLKECTQLNIIPTGIESNPPGPFSHGYRQPPFASSDFAGSSTQQGAQSVSDITTGRRFNLEDITEAYMLAGSHQALPQEYRGEIGNVPFTKQELRDIKDYLQAAINDKRINKDESVRLYNIIRMQTEQAKAAREKYKKSEKGKAANTEYRESEEGKAANKAAQAKHRKSEKRKATNAEYKKSEKGKAANAEYRKSEKGKATQARHEQKRTDAQVFNIKGVEVFEANDLAGPSQDGEE